MISTHLDDEESILNFNSIVIELITSIILNYYHFSFLYQYLAYTLAYKIHNNHYKVFNSTVMFRVLSPFNLPSILKHSELCILLHL